MEAFVLQVCALSKAIYSSLQLGAGIPFAQFMLDVGGDLLRETLRKLHVKFGVNDTMQESGRDINTLKMHILGSGQSQHGVYSCSLGCRCKCFVKVNARALAEILSNDLGLEVFDSAIW